SEFRGFRLPLRPDAAELHRVFLAIELDGPELVRGAFGELEFAATHGMLRCGIWGVLLHCLAYFALLVMAVKSLRTSLMINGSTSPSMTTGSSDCQLRPHVTRCSPGTK